LAQAVLGHEHEMINFGGQEVKTQGHTRPAYVTKIFFGEISKNVRQILAKTSSTYYSKCLLSHNNPDAKG